MTGSGESEASHSRSAQFRAGSKIELTVPATTEPGATSDVDAGFGMWTKAIPGGSENRFRSSASLRPKTGMSTVTTSAEASRGHSARHKFSSVPTVPEDIEREPPRAGFCGHLFHGHR